MFEIILSTLNQLADPTMIQHLPRFSYWTATKWHNRAKEAGH